MFVFLVGIITLSLVTLNELVHSVPLSEATRGNYLVAIRVNNTKRFPTDENWYTCGGSIIDDEHVLTSASCFLNEKNEFEKLNYTIVAGAKDLFLGSEPTRNEIGIKKVYIPTEFKNFKYNPWNNLAVVKLEQSFNLEKNKNISKLRLPKPSDTNYIDQKVHIAGYGLESSISIKSENPNHEGVWNVVALSDGLLHPGNVKIVDKSKCSSSHNQILCVNVLTRNNNDLTNGDLEECMSDTGGPLVFQSDILIGVQSGVHSVTCMTYNLTNLDFEYLDVASRLDFIENAVKDKVNEDIRVHDY